MQPRRPEIVAVLILALSAVGTHAQTKTELSPAVSFHCSNTILRTWHMSDSDYAQMSDDELDDVRAELSDACAPKEGWTIEDGFYRDAALAGVLNRLLLRTRINATKTMQEDTEAFRTLAERRDEMKNQITELQKENRALKDQIKACHSTR
jgi:hypothetical protein